MAVAVGDTAPDFELPATTGDKITLSSYRGSSNVALVFYPFTFTGVCAGELCELRDDLARYEAAGVQVLAISCDTKFAQALWAKDQGYTFPVLSDFWPHGEVARAYGVFNDTVGCAMRGTFIIDKAGVVVDAFQTDTLGQAREKALYDSALAKLA